MIYNLDEASQIILEHGDNIRNFNVQVLEPLLDAFYTLGFARKLVWEEPNMGRKKYILLKYLFPILRDLREGGGKQLPLI